MYETNQDTGYTRRDILKMGTGGLLGLLGLSGCATFSNEVRKFGDGLGFIITKGANYKSVDERLKNIKSLNDILEMVVLYPLDWGFDFARGGKAVVYDIPREALERMSKEAGVKYNPHNKNGIAKVLVAPLQFVGNYLGIAAEGTIQQVTKRPIETILHGLTSYGAGKVISDAAHRTEHHVKVPGEVKPPKSAY